MALSISEITNNIVQQLRLDDPAASAEPGTPERKIIEAVSEIIARSQVDFSVLQRGHDLDTLTGNRLDAYLSNFGFNRQRGTAATGFVTFSRTTPAPAGIVIREQTPLLATLDDSVVPTLTFFTTELAILPSGETSVTVPVRCSTPGSIGNVPADTITRFGALRPIIGITSLTNSQSTSGGTDLETDEDFRSRFKNGIFRNMAGTEDNYLALAVSATTVTKANVIGPSSRYQEYIQVPATPDDAQLTIAVGYDDAGTTFKNKATTEVSTIPYSKFVYEQNHYLTEGILDPSVDKFFKPFVDYVFNATPIDATDDLPSPGLGTHVAFTGVTRPNITVLGRGASFGAPLWPVGLEPGNVVLLEHQYISRHSRNDFNAGILNCVDIFVNGFKEQTSLSTEIVPTILSNTLQDTDAGVWTFQKATIPKVTNFRRKIDGRASAVGSMVMPLYWQPATGIPNSITISDGVTSYTFYRANYYDSGTYYNKEDLTRPAHYILTEEVNGLHGSTRARNGIEWFLNPSPNYLDGADPVDSESAKDSGAYTGKKIDELVGETFDIEYQYDVNVSDLQSIMENHKQVTTDVLVHRAKNRYFKIYITVMYNAGAPVSAVNASIQESIAAFFNRKFFGSVIQMSDILQEIHNVPGVDNVRWTNDFTPTVVKWNDTTAYSLGDYVRPVIPNGHIYEVTTAGTTGGTEPIFPTVAGDTVADGTVVFTEANPQRVEEVNLDGTELEAGALNYAFDFFIEDNELAASPDTNRADIIRRAQNTWSN